MIPESSKKLKRQKKFLIKFPKRKRLSDDFIQENDFLDDSGTYDAYTTNFRIRQIKEYYFLDEVSTFIKFFTIFIYLTISP